jgi:hypothetical protein
MPEQPEHLDDSSPEEQSDWEQGLSSIRRKRLSLAHVFGVIIFIVVILVVARQVSQPGPGASDQPPTTEAVENSQQQLDRPAQYAWMPAKERKTYEPLLDRIPTPDGYTRVAASPGSFADWLRFLPVAPAGTPVTTAKHATVLPADAPGLAAVVALQPQTAKTLSAPNMAIRLRAEWLWAEGKADEAAFHFTSGHLSTWRDWAGGERPTVQGRNVSVTRNAPPDSSRVSFCGYLETVFRYGTVYSLLLDTDKAADLAVQASDVLIRTGKIGHAVVVLDVARNAQGHTRVLLGQGGTPPQTFHVLRGKDGSPWFPFSRTEPIDLGPKGVFQLKDLRRWKS